MGTLRGRVVVKETGEGVVGLVVAATAAPATPPADWRRRLGSVITERDGTFELEYEPLVDGRSGWELIVSVSAPDDSATDPIDGAAVLASYTRTDPAVSESFHIRIAAEKLGASGAVAAMGEHEVERIIARDQTQRRLRAALKAESRRVLAERLAAGQQIREQAMAHLGRFMRALSAADPQRPGSRYVLPGASVREAMAAAIRDGATSTIKQMSMGTVAAFTPEHLATLRERFGDDLSRIPAQAIEEILRPRRPLRLSPSLIRLDPLQWCRRQVPLNDCVVVIDPDTAEQGQQQDADELPAGEAAAGVGPPATVEDLVARLTRTMTSPEEEVLFGVRPGIGDIQGNVDGFELRSGPADVPATYDFHRMEIAFEPVWQELFDRGTWHLGLQLFEKVVELGDDPNKFLLDAGEIAKIPNYVPDDAPLAEPDPTITEAFEITRQEWNALDGAHQNRLRELVTELDTEHTNAKSFHDFVANIPTFLQSAKLDEIRRAFEEEYDRAVGSIKAKAARIVKYAKEKLQEPDEFDHFHQLFGEFQKRLREPYRFNIYAAGPRERSINFGVLVTYRQKWTPVTYQVGELVKTVPLAPKETRKYTRRMVRKLSRAEKESSSTLESLRTESTATVRAEAEIINKARTKTNYDVDTKAGVNIEFVKVEGSTKLSQETDQQSQETKKEFREAVFKAATEYRSEHKLEVEVTDTSEFSEEESGEISNPNDELPVTYLFYELQRRYRVEEKQHKVTRVILVAQEFTDNIDEDWVIAHDSILRQHVLHPSMVPAMDYLATKIVGDEFALKEQYDNLQQQRRILDQLTNELTVLRTQVSHRYDALQRSMLQRADATAAENNEGFLQGGIDTMFGGFDADPEAMKAREDAARDAYERLARQESDLTTRVQNETAAVTEATERYIKPLSDHLNRKAQIARLLIHIRANLFHYMQAIYAHEPTDQRYFRLRDVQVPRLTGTMTYSIVTDPDGVPQPPTWTKPHTLQAHVEINPFDLKYDSLGDIADLDNLLGFKGNYMIFPLKEGNALTDWMMTPYYDPFSGMRDPDQLANWTLHEFAEYVCCLRKHSSKEKFDSYLPGLIETYRRLKDRDYDDGELVVPTGSLYIEALPGTHPILEDFKLAHRAIDVKKVQAEVRSAEMENLRMAARLLAGEREDPTIEKKVVVEGTPSAIVPEA